MAIALFFSLSASCIGNTCERPFEGEAFAQTVAVMKQGSAREAVWSLSEDGVLQSNGKDDGYLRTPKMYEDFLMTFEWRWSATPANAGILVYIQQPDHVWPSNVEAQLKAGEAGDILLVGVGSSARQEDRLYEISPDAKRRFLVIPAIHERAEHATGAWNQGRIECSGGTFTYHVNEVEMNQVELLQPRTGFIGLATLGGAIEYRNIVVYPSSDSNGISTVKRQPPDADGQ